MAEYKFSVGDRVAYGTNGICSIDKIEMMSIASGMPEMPYYVLKPESSESSTVYVPVNNEKLVSKMRYVLTPDQLETMVTGSKGKEIAWNNDRRFRTERFHDILTSGVGEDLILMIDCIYRRKNALTLDGKKLPATDSNILKQAEKLVKEEFSSVLDIPVTEVARYIRSHREDDYVSPEDTEQG